MKFLSSGQKKKDRHFSEFILYLLHNLNGHSFTCVHPTLDLKVFPEPAWICPDFLLKPEPETGSKKTGNPDFLKVVELVPSFLYVPLTQNWVLGAKFPTGTTRGKLAGRFWNGGGLLTYVSKTLLLPKHLHMIRP